MLRDGQFAGVDALHVVARSAQQQPEQRRAFGQLLVGADVGDPAAVQHRDPVGQRQGGPAVRDQDGGTAADQLPQGAQDLGLDPRVDRAGGIVEQHDPRIGEQCPGERDPLALAAGQGQAALAHQGVVAVGQFPDELVGLGGPSRRLDLLGAGRRTAVGDVGGDGVGEQEAVLEDHADLRAQVGQPQRAHVHSADPQGSVVHVVEAGDEHGQGRLARTGPADDGQRLAGLDVQIQPAQHRLGSGVAEPDVGEAQPQRAVRQLPGVLGIDDGGGGVDHLQHPLHPGPGLLADGEQRADLPDRTDQLAEVGRERKERADGDLAVQRQPAAQQQHAELAERGDGGQRRGVLGLEADHPHPQREQRPGLPAQLGDLAGFLAEPLDHPDAGHRGLDVPDQLAGLLLGRPVGREQIAPRRVGHHPQRRCDGQRDQGQQRGEPEHGDQRDDEQQRVSGQRRNEGQQTLHQAHVADRPADHLPGLQGILRGAVQSLQRGEDVTAQVVLHVQGQPAGGVATEEGQPVLQQCGDDEHRHPAVDRAVVGAGRADDVDDVLDHQRHRHRDQGAGQGGAERAGQIERMPAAVAGQPPQPGRRLRRGG